MFKGIGRLQVKHHIELKEQVSQVVVHAPRKVPISLRNRLHKELNKIEKLNIVSKVDEPTDWVNSLVIVEKKTGQLRLCIDPRDLNKNIKREHFHLPTKTKITAELAGAKWFTKLDASNEFWQIEPDYVHSIHHLDGNVSTDTRLEYAQVLRYSIKQSRKCVQG